MHDSKRGALAWLARIGLATASVCLVFAVAEIWVRWSSSSDRERATPRNYGALPQLKGLVALGRPNVRGIHKGVLHRNNDLGFRGPPVDSEAADGTFRIAVIGDSITMGWGVEEELTYAVRTENLLDRRPPASSPPQRFEILNFGLAGLNAQAGINRLIQLSRHTHPDLAIYGFTVNDIEGEHYRETTASESAGKLNRRYRKFRSSRSHLARALWPSVVALGERISPTVGSPVEVARENYFDNPAAWHDFDDALARLAKFGEENGICVAVLIHTKLTGLGPFHPYGDIYDAVGAAAESHGIEVIESLDHFPPFGDTHYWVNALDPHPNDLGHAILADALRDGLEALPAECWIADSSTMLDTNHGERTGSQRPGGANGRN